MCCVKAMKEVFICAVLFTSIGIPSYGCWLASSCSELHSRSPSLGDGEYRLGAPGCQMVEVYCADMMGEPAEYISLIEENYSYGRHPSIGTTTFTKVRIDLPSMKIIDNDHLFATWTGERGALPYMFADDCQNQIYDGEFLADLSGTGFLFSDLVDAPVDGYAPHKIIRVSTNLVKKYNCGGYCGWCRINLDVSHHLEVDPTFNGFNDVLGTPATVQINQPVEDISYLYDDTDNPGYNIPIAGGSATDKAFVASTYQRFDIAEKTTIKLPVVTDNVPCWVSSHFLVAVVKSSPTAALKEMNLCSMEAYEPGDGSPISTCFWLISCVCSVPSTSCLIRVSFYSGLLQTIGDPWKILKMGEAWAE